jgi:hypothetical protein
MSGAAGHGVVFCAGRWRRATSSNGPQAAPPQPPSWDTIQDIPVQDSSFATSQNRVCPLRRQNSLKVDRLCPSRLNWEEVSHSSLLYVLLVFLLASQARQELAHGRETYRAR